VRRARRHHNAKSHSRVRLADDELKAAFAFFDRDGKGYITKKDLAESLPIFFPNLKPSEYVYLMNKKQQLNLQGKASCDRNGDNVCTMSCVYDLI
jgi:Ca2+-binding EF-hand superfamily protein